MLLTIDDGVWKTLMKSLLYLPHPPTSCTSHTTICLYVARKLPMKGRLVLYSLANTRPLRNLVMAQQTGGRDANAQPAGALEPET